MLGPVNNFTLSIVIDITKKKPCFQEKTFQLRFSTVIIKVDLTCETNL